MTEKETVRLPYDHRRVASHVGKNLRRRGLDPEAVSGEESARLIRRQCAKWDMHEPPTTEA